MSAPVDVLAVLSDYSAQHGNPEDFERAIVAVAELIAQRDALRSALDRIVWYYDAIQRNGRLPSMDSQAECRHESTMFGEARAALARCTGGAASAKVQVEYYALRKESPEIGFLKDDARRAVVPRSEAESA